MIQNEGVIKFQINFTETKALPERYWHELNHWRNQLFAAGLVGMDPERYEGCGYGNVSQRLNPDEDTFIICGTQTGGIPSLKGQHFVTVDDCDFNRNRITAHGPIKPSSESLTHGIIYQTNPSINFVFHIHSPHLWQHRQQWGIPCTGSDAEYGTQKMVQEVRELLSNDAVRNGHIVAMDGHEDGIVSFGATGKTAAGVLTSLLNKIPEMN